MRLLSTCFRAALAMNTLCIFASTPYAKADTVTDLSFAYTGGGVNSTGQWLTEINGSTIVAASKSGNANSNLTFANWSGQFNEIDAGVTRTFTFAPVALTTNAVVNSLMNLFYGSTANQAVVSFGNNLGQTVSYTLVGDQTIRDYNNAVFANDLLGYNTNAAYGAVTTQLWWSNGLGQRLDAQTFVLPTSWAGSSLTSMTVMAPLSSGGDDVLSALQVDDLATPTPPPTITPEPGSFVLVGSGAFGILAALRRRVA